ncbi:hypothetical protein B0H14DRAFT_2624825 [Mycena olivaceomarginata]|nr:hypothetical protein B0H14DRAFT_2624825 [Mycena olivaceomarginata]
MFIPHPSLPVHLTEQWIEVLSVTMQDDDAQDNDQVGGGQRRSATPPETLSPTRLRTRIKLTSRAGPDMVHVAGLRAGLRPSTPPPTINPAILESPLHPDPLSSSPLPSASTALPITAACTAVPASLVPSITSAPTPFPPPPIHTSPSFRLAIEEEATDAFADGSVEMDMDASVEMGADVSVEMGADASSEMGADASVEMGVDASGEMGADASGEMGASASGKMGADASVEMRADASDAANNFSYGDEVESPRRGRPDKTKLDAVAACHAAVDALVKNCALATGLSQEKILCSYHHVPTPSCSSNGWNIYQRYANTLENWAEELVRAETAVVKANPSFVLVPTPAGEPPHALTPDEIKAAWPLFPKGLLDDWDALDRLSNEISIGTRHRQFTRTTRDIIGMLKKFVMKFGFHSLSIMTGSYLNEDGKLAVLHSTGGLQKLLSTLRSDLNDYDVVALVKLAAYTEEIGFTLLGGDEDAQMAAAASAGKAEKVYKGRNAPQPEVIDLTTLPVKKREQVLRQTRHQKSVDDTHSLQDIMTSASNENVGVNIYREKSGRSKVFGWRRLDVILSEGDFIIKNFPASVRDPAQMPATWATSTWRAAEREALQTALAARTGGPHQGLRVERRKYELGAVVIYSHDYTLTPPEGPPDSPLVRKFWRSSNGAPVNCTDGNRAVWHMQYDLHVPLQYSPRTLAKDKGKGKEKEKVKRKRKDADKDEEATMPVKRGKKTAPWATSTRPVPAQAPMQEGGGHRGNAMRDLDSDRADNGEDTLPRPLRSALAGSRSESQHKDQSVRWDIAEHSWLHEDEDQPLQDLKRRLESRHTTADPAAMPVDEGNKSELTPPPSPRPQPVPPLHHTSIGRQADSSAKPVDDSNKSELTPPPSPRPRPQPVPPPRHPAAGARRQPANWRSADTSVGRQVDSSAKHKADTSGGRERVPAASTTLPPTSITRCVTRSSTTATAASSSSAGPPNAVAGPSKPSQKWQTGSFNAVASSSKLPPTDSGMLYSIKNLQPIGQWYEVDNAVFGRLGM